MASEKLYKDQKMLFWGSLLLFKKRLIHQEQVWNKKVSISLWSEFDLIMIEIIDHVEDFTKKKIYG